MKVRCSNRWHSCPGKGRPDRAASPAATEVTKWSEPGEKITIDLGSIGGKEVSVNLSPEAKNLGKWIKAAKTAGKQNVDVKLVCKLTPKSGGSPKDVTVTGTLTLK